MNNYLVMFKDGTQVPTMGDWYEFKDNLEVIRFNEEQDIEEQVFTAKACDISYIVLVEEKGCSCIH